MIRSLFLVIVMLALPRMAAATEAWNGRYSGKTAAGESCELVLESVGAGFISGLFTVGGRVHELDGFLEDGVLLSEVYPRDDEGEGFFLKASLSEPGIEALVVPLDDSGEPREDAGIALTLPRHPGSSTASGGDPRAEADAPARKAPDAATRSGTQLDGTWVGTLFEARTTLTLRVEDGALTGDVDAAGYPYRLSGTLRDGKVTGTLLDPKQGGELPFELARSGADVTLVLFLPDNSGGTRPVTATFQPAGSRGKERDTGPKPPETGVERDPALVGRWVRTQSYTSGDFSAATESVVEIYADGTFAIGGGRVVGGGDAGSFDSGSPSGAQETGRWKTENRVVYVQDAGSGGWTPYARYYVEGNSLLVTYGDNSKEVWYRR